MDIIRSQNKNDDFFYDCVASSFNTFEQINHVCVFLVLMSNLYITPIPSIVFGPEYISEL